MKVAINGLINYKTIMPLDTQKNETLNDFLGKEKLFKEKSKI